MGGTACRSGVLAEFFLTSQNGVRGTFFPRSGFDDLTATVLGPREDVFDLSDWLPFQLRVRGSSGQYLQRFAEASIDQLHRVEQ